MHVSMVVSDYQKESLRDASSFKDFVMGSLRNSYDHLGFEHYTSPVLRWCDSFERCETFYQYIAKAKTPLYYIGGV